MLRRIGIIATAGLVVGLGASPALADTTVTVHGTDFPDPREAQLTLVGCDSLYDRSSEVLLPRISRGPGREAGQGTRSLKYDLAGGNAIGTLSYVDSMAGTAVAGLEAYAPDGASGVAYAGFQRPDAGGTYHLWIGRAPLTATSSWERVDATSLTYTWAEFDMQTGQATGETAAEPSTVADFAAANGGDGAGFYMVGFGCDGAPFYMDGWQIGAPGTTTTYDLEGLTTRLTMRGSARGIEPGEEVTISGSVRDGTGRRLSRGTMILEAKPVGGAGFLPVTVVEAAESDPSVTVSPRESTIYRWRFADRPLAYGSVSEPFRVDVVRHRPRESPRPDDGPSPRAPETRTPSAPPTAPPTSSSSSPTPDASSAPPSPEPSTPPTTAPAPTATPAEPASDAPSPTP